MDFEFDPGLWGPQLRSINRVLDAFDEGARRVLLFSPTGSGKTRIAGELFRHAVHHGHRGVFYVNRKLLVGQTDERFRDIGLDVGIRAADYEYRFDDSADVQIASADTERARVFKSGKWEMTDVGDGGLIVVDEAHMQKTKVMKDILQYYEAKGARILLLTATPVAMKDWAQTMVVGGKLSEWRACGALVPVYCYSPSQPDLRKIKRNNVGEFVMDDGKKMEYLQTIAGEVVENIELLNDGSPIMCYGPGVPESVWLTKKLCDRGHNFVHVDATDAVIDGKRVKMSQPLWDEIMDGVKCGDIKGISSRFKCLDMDTEVLTATGWKKRKEISKQDIVASVDEDGKLTFQFPERIIDSYHDGMFAVWKNDSVDIRVTDDHTMVVRSQDRRCVKWKRVEACELGNRKSNYQIPVAGIQDVPDMPLTDSQVSLLGWMMTDGHFGKDGRWSITQSTAQPSEIHSHIRDTLSSCGIEYREHRFTPKIDGKEYAEAIRYVIPKDQVPNTGVAGCAEKDFSLVLLSLSKRQLQVMLHAINLADGSKRKSPSWTPKTLEIGKGNELFLSRLQALCVTRGMRANLHKRKDGCFILYITPGRDYANVRGATKTDSDGHSRLRVRYERSSEPVWCLTMPGGTLVTRRNGKVAVVGNCREGVDLPMAGHCVLATPVGSLASYLQIVGRVLRSAPGKTQAILQDHGGCYHMHGSPNQDRPWDMLWKMSENTASTLHQDQVREGEIKEPIRCPKCGMERTSGSKCIGCGHEASKSVRAIRMESGELEEIEGPLIKPRKRKLEPTTEQDWAKMFWGLRKKKSKLSFKQMEAFFCKEHGYLPPRDLPFMPKNFIDWSRKVHEVDMRDLHHSFDTNREAAFR